jgi:16S rRNA (guanine966-N2)-methyltransferase
MGLKIALKKLRKQGTSPSSKLANSNSLRIIGGAWRSRRIQFIDSPKIRPTPDRVRETLFNWLTATINGASCLDLFAGSGALGFESASRGARQVVMVEEDARIAATLKQQKDLLQTPTADGAIAQNIEVKNQNALAYLPNVKQQFDVIFLDPPFDSMLLEKIVPMILEQNILSQQGVLYVESAAKQELPPSLKELNCIREKTNGEVCYALFE